MNNNTVSSSNQSIYDIDSNQYEIAVNKCKEIYNSLCLYLHTYKYKHRLTIDKKSYHFKLINIETKNGIHVCIPPYNPSIELYYIFNNKRDNVNCVILDNEYPVNDIIYHMKKCMFNCESQEDEIVSILSKLSEYLCNYSDTYELKINKYNISFIEKNTNNGYNLSINYATKNYICIKVIQNNCYFDNKNYIFNTDSFSKACDYIIHSIIDNKHNKVIKCYKIIDTRYMIDDNLNNYQNIYDRLNMRYNRLSSNQSSSSGNSETSDPV